jgi:hypothetical protein
MRQKNHKSMLYTRYSTRSQNKT